MSRKQEVIQICEETQKFFIERMCELKLENKNQEAAAIYEEIKEWIEDKEKSRILTLRRVSKA
jgi:hypothetical protein